MKLARRIGDGNRIAIPSDVITQMGLQVGDTLYIDIINIDGYPVITMKGDKSYEEIRRIVRGHNS